jgi:hypothetical protein
MKVIIAGSRDFKNPNIVVAAVVKSRFTITEVVSGGARGIDRFGEQYAKANKIPIKQFIPDWSTGRGAGFKRNIEMAEYADALIAIWDGVSRGTAQMIREAEKRGLQVYVFRSTP